MSPVPPHGRGGLSVVPGGQSGDERSSATPPVPREAPNTGLSALRPLGLVEVDLVPPPAPDQVWTDAEADAWLAARDLVGWRFALDRIKQLLHALGDPHRAAPAIHVVGTNGKSSTTRMIAALLAAEGHKPGAFLSPHLADLRERIELGGVPISAEQHAAAVAKVARAAAQVDRPGDPVTQFEAHTASAFVALRDAGCDVFVIEAGLGGRLDATNVLDAPVVALTSVDLEHTALLGDTVEAIAGEKVAVVTSGSTLLLGAGLSEAATIVARTHAAGVGAQVVTAKPEALDRALGAPYQQRNFALARAACEAFGGALDLRLVREVARAFAMPARFETIDTAPLTILDGAHNPAGARALAQALRNEGLGTEAVAVLSILSDKDAAGIVDALSGSCDRFVLCDCGSPRVLAPAELGAVVADRSPNASVQLVSDPVEALRTAQTIAGPAGVVVICGTLALARTLRGQTPPPQDIA